MKKLTFSAAFCLFVACIFTLNTPMCFSQWVPTGSINGDFVECFLLKGTDIYAGTGSGIYKTTNNGDNWIEVNSSLPATAMIVKGQNIFVSTFGSGVYKSTNDGLNWFAANNGITDLNLYTINTNGLGIFSGSQTSGVYVSSDDGLTWINKSNGLTNLWVQNITFSGSYIFAATWGGGIFRTADGGNNWITVNNGLPQIKFIKCLALSGPYIFAGIYATGTDYGVYKSSDFGNTWTGAGLLGGAVVCLAVSGSHMFAGLYDIGVQYTNNNGLDWYPKNQGFPVVPTVYALTVANNYVFSNYYNSGSSGPVYRRLFSEIIIGVNNISSGIPSSFDMKQNYPNPFNPVTKIRFEVPHSELISIRVYDVSGKMVRNLVSQKLNPGVYETEFQAQNLTSGVYFYTMEAGSYKITRKMILLK